MMVDDNDDMMKNKKVCRIPFKRKNDDSPFKRHKNQSNTFTHLNHVFIRRNNIIILIIY
jgi:hypothetical protein